MAKENKKPAVEAPTVKKPSTEEKKPNENAVSVLQVGDLDKLGKSYTKNGGLDANHRIDLLTGLRVMFHDDPTVAENLGISKEAVDKINGITALGYAAALIDEVQFGPSGWAAKMRVSQLEELKTVMPLLGVTLDTKALPAPDKDGNVTVKKENIHISKESKEKLKEERKLIDEKPETDPTKIKTDEQLKKAVGFQLVNPKITSPIDRLLNAANFYRSYLSIKAQSSENKDAELEKIKGYTISDLLQDISTMVPPTFTASGFGKFLCGCTAYSKSVVSAFNMFKRAATNRETGVCKFTDEEIAAIVRVLIVWESSAQIAEIGKSIEKHNEAIEILNKNAKANAKGIESEKKKIEECTNKISYFQGMISLTTDPSFDIADNFIAAYNDKENPLHNCAKELYKSTIETYYKGVEIPELEMDTVLLNVQQRVGIILNLFNDSLLRRDEYSEENLISLSTEENPTEEKPKNE